MIVFDQNLKIFYSTLISDDKYFSGFSTRPLGDGRRVETLMRFFKTSGIPYRKLVVLEQIHSVNVSEYVYSGHDDFAKIEETDGVVTREKEIALTVRTGDCCPIIFVDKTAGITGVSHQGWRGSLKKMAKKMVERMVSIGTSPENINVAIGPTIGDCCYDVQDDRYYEFLSEFESYADKIFHLKGGKKYLNLSRLNHLLLMEAGVPSSNIDHFPFCTKCDTNRFFSFRRDKKEDYGEMFSFIIGQ